MLCRLSGTYFQREKKLNEIRTLYFYVGFIAAPPRGIIGSHLVAIRGRKYLQIVVHVRRASHVTTYI